MSNVSIEVISPIPGANVGTQRIDVMTVKVRVSAEDGVDLSGITSVMADQVALSQSADDSMLWYGQIAANPGEYTLEIEVDGPGLSGEQSVNYLNDVAYAVGESILLDEGNNRLIVANGREPNVFAVDLNTGVRTLLADKHIGSGPELQQTWGIAWLEQGSSILVNARRVGLITLDLATGNRNVVSSADIGSGEMFGGLYQLELDSSNSRVFAADGAYDAIFVVDLASGDRTIVSKNDAVGSGENFNRIYSLRYHPASNVLYVADRPEGTIFRVDVASGDRTVLSDELVGTGPGLNYVHDIQLDLANNRLLATNYDRSDSSAPGSIIAIDITSGNRTDVASTNVGAGSALVRPQTLSPLDATNNVYVSSLTEQRIYKVNTTNGNREILTNAHIGSGPRLGVMQLELSLDNSTVIAFNREDPGLIEMNLSTGNRELFVGNSQGAGVDLMAPRDFTIDWLENIAYILDYEYKGIVRIDLTTGNRSLIPDEVNGVNLFENPSHIVYDNLRDRIYVTDAKGAGSGMAIMEINPSTGAIAEAFSDAVADSFRGELELPWGGQHLAIRTSDSFKLIETSTGVVNEIPVGSAFFNGTLYDLRLDEANERLFVVRRKNSSNSWDTTLAEIFYDGTFNILSGNSVGGGRAISSNRGTAYDAGNNRFLVGDVAVNGIVSVALETGDRITISQ